MSSGLHHSLRSLHNTRGIPLAQTDAALPEALVKNFCWSLVFVLRHTDMGLAVSPGNTGDVIFLSATDAMWRKACKALPHREGKQAVCLGRSVQTPSVSADIDFVMKLLRHTRKKLWAITSAAGKALC